MKTWIRSAIASFLVLLLSANLALADVIVLRNGKKYEGTVANREEVRSNPKRQTAVSILVSETDTLRRVSVDDIEYVVLEDQYRTQVIDFKTLATERRPSAIYVPKTLKELEGDESGYGNGPTLLVFGAIVEALGLLVKFGGEKATVTTSSVEYDEKSYNAINYGLMILGGVLIVSGIFEIAEASSNEQSALSGPVIGFRSGEDGVSPLVGYRFDF